MKYWKRQTLNYFSIIAGAVLFVVIMILLLNSIQSRQVNKSLTTYMENLRDMVFMSTYDSLKKGNMKVFKNHLEEIATFEDVQEFSLLDTRGLVHYSSNPTLVNQVDPEVVGLPFQKNLLHEDFTTYYFPVETIGYCSRCHPDWQIGAINSYYRLTLSRKALDALANSDAYFQWFMVIGGIIFLAFFYQLFSQYEQRKQEEQLLMSDSVRSFMDSTAEPFLTVDPQGLCTFCNAAGLRQLGYQDVESLLGQNLHALIHHSDAAGNPYPKDECLVQKTIAVGKSLRRDETILWRADGSSFAAEYRSHPIVKDGVVYGATVTFQDITERKAEEARTVQVSHLASLGEMAAGVAHEINNPIGGVINYAQICKNKYVPDAAGQELLDRIIKEGTRISSIVTSLLHYSYQGADVAKPVDMRSVVAETLNLFQARLDRDGINLGLNIDENIPLVSGNFQYLEQVLMNLLSNASYALNKKYPEPPYTNKKIQITVENRQADDWPHVRLKVTDLGTGIPAELVNKVMHPFITTKPAGDGTGLGLNVCYRIVKQHNGKIQIESQFGEFTRVNVDLPIQD